MPPQQTISAECNFFISYTEIDRQWAEWIAWELEAEGYTTRNQAWDFRPGGNFILEMHKAASECERTIAILSEAFFHSGFGAAEWSSAFAIDPTGESGTLLPVRVTPTTVPPLLKPRVFIDLVGCTEETARQRLLHGVRFERAKPATRPRFPGEARPKAPFPMPATTTTVKHNLPFPPSLVFVGRNAALDAIHGALATGQYQVAITQTIAITGFGGVGKTQLALEYAWQGVANRVYAVVLWLRSASIESLESEIAGLAIELGLREADDKKDTVRRSAVVKWLREAPEPWLIVADNADDENVAQRIRQLLPVSSTGHVIVTSRLETWPGFSRIVLEVLDIDDAIHVLQSAIQHEVSGHNPGSEDEARRLALELGCLPIALRQAAAYMAEARWTFTKYREEFASQRQRLLNANKLDETRYPEPVATTWAMTLARLSPLAQNILQLCSYLAPDDIPRELFVRNASALAHMLNVGRDLSSIEVDEHLVELARYSLIKLSQNAISVHRLLQAVEQDDLAREREQTNALRAAIILVDRLWSSYGSDNLEIASRLRPHVEILIVAATRQALANPQTVLLESALTVHLVERAEYYEAEKHARAALEAAITLTPAVPDLIGAAQNNLGTVLLAQNRLSEAEDLLTTALTTAQTNGTSVSYHIASLANNLAGVKEDLGQLRAAADLYADAIQIMRQLPASQQEMALPKIICNRGGILKALGRYEEAENALREGLGILDPTGSGNGILVGRALNDLGFLLRDIGRYSEAEPMLRRALEIAELNFGPSHPQVAAALDNLGSLLRLSGRVDEAEPLIRRALVIEKAHLGPDHPKVAVILVNLALLLAETDRPGEAERLFRRALQIDEVAFGSQHREVAHDLDRLGNFLASIGRFQEAESLTKKALAIVDELEGGESRLLNSIRDRLAALVDRRRRRRRRR